MTSLIEKLSRSLVEEDTDANRKRWKQYIIDNNIALLDLMSLLEANRKVGMRFIWMVGDLCESNPSLVFPAITHFYSRRHHVPFANFDRSLAKMFWLVGVPEEIEGEAINDLFKWLMDAKVNVTTKVYALSALYNLSLKYDDLRNELKLVVEDQLGKSSISFEQRAKQILKKLG